MSLSVPYSLVAEPDAAIQISESGSRTNPFLTEPQTTSNVDDVDAAGKQQLLVASNAALAKGGENRGKLHRENHSNSFYIPPETVLARTGRGSVLQTNSESTDTSQASSSDRRYSTPSNLFRVENKQSLGLDPLSQDEDSFVGKDTATSEIVDDDKKHLERPHSLHLTTSSIASRAAVDAGQVNPQEQTSVKGILKKSSGSVTFDTEVQISYGGNSNPHPVAAGIGYSSRHAQPDCDDDTQQLIELEQRCSDQEVEEEGAAADYSVDDMRRLPPRQMLKRLKTELNLDVLAQNELELKANMFYHIGNPIKRWRVEKVIPGKLILQLLKTFCLIVQVVLYTNTFPRNRAEFFYESREIFENLFFQNFNQENPRDFYSAFNAEDILSQFNYTVNRYCQLPKITIGGYDFAFDENNEITPVSMTLQQYAVANFNTLTGTYIVDGTIVERQFTVACGEDAIARFVNESGDRLFNRFVELVISFPIKNMRVVHPEKVECYVFWVSIHFKVEDNSGVVIYFLREDHWSFDCVGEILTQRRTFYAFYGVLTVLDVMVLVMCVLSIFLTCSSLRRGYKLYKAMGVFYEKQLQINLSWWDRRSLFPVWHAINTISDLLIISGSISKILLDFFVFDYSAPVRVLLGTAIIFQAMVILRYISYFKQLNALTRTVYLAFPELLKFLLCSGILFIAFAMTGWIVLGPFHDKFENLNDAIETLFGLLNGDDIYSTFTQIRPQDDYTAYVYSRIFLYVFLALFIYAVLNLFTSLIITAYEASQDWDTATRNEVRRFVFSGPLTSNGIALRDFGLTKKYVDPKLIKEKKRTSLKKRISLSVLSRSRSLTGHKLFSTS